MNLNTFMTMQPRTPPTTPKPVSGFKFSTVSLLRLNDVKPDLVRVIKRALELSKTDFLVLEGLRSLERQKELVAKGASKTLKSRHLTGDAVDIAPLIGGVVSWDWPAYYALADAVRAAAIELKVKVVWGGVWDKNLNDITGSLVEEVKAYCVRHAGPDFIDGPHFQLA